MSMFYAKRHLEKFLAAQNIPYEIEELEKHSNLFHLPNYSLHLVDTIYNSEGLSPFEPMHIIDIEKNKFKKLADIYQKKGRKLFTIYSTEYTPETDVISHLHWNSLILSAEGKSPKKIYARECRLEKISGTDSRDFMKYFHRQRGGYIGNIRYGLFYRGEMVAAMTFGTPRFGDYGEGSFELIRFASKPFTNVIGGASKLLKAFEKEYNPKKLVSYANRRWSDGSIYKILGFDQISVTEPNFFCYIPGEYTLMNRQNFQKHKLKKLFPEIYSDELTAKEIILLSGLRIIYDTGNFTFLKKYEEENGP